MDFFLNVELLALIASESLSTWKALLSLPYFARWSLTAQGKQTEKNIYQTITIDGDGTKIWKYKERKYRNDGPAVEFTDGTK